MRGYTLPPGNVQIAFSGGRTSAYMLHQLLAVNGDLPDRCKVIFTNTGREMPETLDFVNECATRWGVYIYWLEYRLKWTGADHDPSRKIFDKDARQFEQVSHNNASQNGEPFEAVMEYYGYTPNRSGDFCSHELKTRTASRFCINELGWDHWTTAIGIRSDEPGRLLKRQPRERYKVWYPLADGDVTKDVVSDFWKQQDFDLNLANINGVTPMGNCDGCFKKSEWKRSVLARDYPDRANWWANMEQKYKSTFREAEPWGGIIDFVERQGDWIFEHDNDVLCQVDGGECTG